MIETLKVHDSRMLAQTLVIEAMLKQLIGSKLINAETLAADIDEHLRSPTSIWADPVNVKTMQFELKGWHDMVLHILKNV